MRTIEIQFEHSGVLYAATAEFLPASTAAIRVSEFYPSLPGHRHEAYFVYNTAKQRMDFPYFGKNQKGLAETLFTAICECCHDSEVLSEMGLGANKAVPRKNSWLARLVPAA